MTNPTDALQSIAADQQARLEQRRAEIASMAAGPELDAFVAEHVLGHALAVDADPSDPRDRVYIVFDDGGSQSLPPYSTDAGASSLILKWFETWPLTCNIGLWWQEGQWTAHVYYYQVDNIVGEACAESPSLELAIARAALLARLEQDRQSS